MKKHFVKNVSKLNIIHQISKNINFLIYIKPNYSKHQSFNLSHTKKVHSVHLAGLGDLTLSGLLFFLFLESINSLVFVNCYVLLFMID